jgi:RHS repeat-associated protein
MRAWIRLAKDVVAALGLMAALMLSASAAGMRAEVDKAEAAAAPAVDPPSFLPGEEVVSLRTRTSRTYVTEEGTYRRVTSLAPVNYRDAQGRWQPIDSRLVAASGGYENKANDVRVRMPQSLAAPVRVQRGGIWAAFQLVGAQTRAPVVDRATATYRDALPGVTARYTALAEGVKEELVLQSRAAPSVFRFLLIPGPGLAPRLRQGEVELTDTAGTPKLAFRPPFMVDSSRGPNRLSRAVSLTLQQVPGGFGLTLSADRAWLESPERVYPVTIDPTLDIESSGGVDTYMDCWIQGPPNADTNECRQEWFTVGHPASAGVSRALLRWDVDDVPTTANVLKADMHTPVWAYGASPAGFPVSLHELTYRYTKGATWNSYDGTNPWPGGAGGRFVQEPLTTTTVPEGIDPSFYSTELVQDWVSQMKQNDGMLLKAVNESLDEYVDFWAADFCPEPCLLGPTMNVDWRERLGLRRLYTFESQELTDRLTAHVNVGNGNLVLEAQDLSIAGTGLDLGLGRYFNNLQLFSRALGNGWSLSTGQDVFLTEHPDGSVILTAPSFFPVRYKKKQDGSYSRPTAIDATLVKTGANGWTLTFHEDGSKWIFNAQRRLTAEEDRNGNRISYTYTSGRVTQITDTQGRVTTLSYNAANKLSQIIDPASRRTTFAYTSGYLTSVTDADNKVTTYAYDGSGNLKKVCDARGNRTLFSYDGSRRVTSITRVTSAGTCADATGTGPTTTFLYGSPNCTVDTSVQAQRCSVVRDPRNYGTTYQLDNELRAKKATDALGKSSILAYTTNSDLRTRTNHAGKVWENFWSTDGNDNLERSKLPTGAEQSWTYTDPLHKYYPKTATDPQGKTTSFTYDTRGNVTQVLNAAGDTAFYTYTTKGLVDTSTDFKGNLTDYGYDAQGNHLTSVDYPGPLGTVTLSYDSLSRLRTVTDGKGQTTTYSYDPLDRVTQIQYHDGQTITNTYDGNGNLLTTADNTGTTTYTYDKLNRLEQEVLPGPKTLGYGYDPSSNLISLTDQGGTVTYVYNELDLLSSLTAPVSGQTTFAYEPDFDHRRTQINYPNGVTQYLRYDDSNRLRETEGKKPAGPTLTKFSYTFLNGSDTALRQWVEDKDLNRTTYTYDSLSRLKRAERTTGGGLFLEGWAYAYDKNSSRCRLRTLTASSDATPANCVESYPNTIDYTHNAADQLTQAGSTDYVYDLNGNEDWNSAGRDFGYNVKDQVTSATPPAGGPIAMSYTGPGQFERVTRGSTMFTTGALGLGREQTGGAVTDFTRDDDGLLLALRTGPSAASTYYPLFDGIGSVAALTDSNGDLAASYRYEPFGKRVSCQGSGCSLPNPYQWLGGLGVYLDEATGLYKMGTRYYDPALGRFTQVDPVEGGSLNRYDYAAQDPINVGDPDGTCNRLLKVLGLSNREACDVERVRQAAARAPSSVGRASARFFRKNAPRIAKAVAKYSVLGATFAAGAKLAESPEARRRFGLCLAYGWEAAQKAGAAVGWARALAGAIGCVKAVRRGY